MRLAITSILLLIIAVSLQILLPSDIFLGGKIDFALLIIIYVSLVSGSSFSLLLAFFGGLLVDSFTTHFFGSSALTYVIIAYIITLLHKKLYFNNLMTMFSVPFFATIGKTIIILIIILITKFILNSGYNISTTNFLLSMVSEVFLNSLIAPILYFLLNKVAGTKYRNL